MKKIAAIRFSLTLTLFQVFSSLAMANPVQTFTCTGESIYGRYSVRLTITSPMHMKVVRDNKALVAVNGDSAITVQKDKDARFVYSAYGVQNYQAWVTLSNGAYESTDGLTIPAKLEIAGGDDNEEEDSVRLTCKL